MISATRVVPPATVRTAVLQSHMPRAVTGYSGAAVRRQLVTQNFSFSTSYVSALTTPANRKTTFLQPVNLPVSQLTSPWTVLPVARSFHAAASRYQQQQTGKESSKEESHKEESKEESKDEGKREAPPPPPPHGDKTPWQVFRDTLQAEFKASKEWNESTKALASSAHQFTENESIKRARAAYEAASGAASSGTSSAFKTTGKAIGKGAAWTWNTPVVKGVRKGLVATGSGIEKITRPVRETEAYKTAVGGVKNAIDDGSSSRYGGWLEKEERRKQRQLREQMEAQSGRSNKVEQMVEDPK